MGTLVITLLAVSYSLGLLAKNIKAFENEIGQL